MLLVSALIPVAVFCAPPVLLKSAESPLAVLKPPVVLLKRANAPLAVLSGPVVLLKSAPAPVAVFSSAVLARSVPAPDGRIELASGVAPERKETNRRIEATAGETKQSVLPFRGIATGVASIRCRTDRLRVWENPNADDPDQNVN